ncbi:MAG: hypothetical protein SXA11_09535 [Cyanobacteriota bacterium]|nr:hypothetical protein [Cyanobacteriota bacterium]
MLKHYRSFAYAIPMLVGIGLIPLQALKNLQLEIARAMDDITLAYAPSEIIWPVLAIGGGAFLQEAFIIIMDQTDLNSLFNN